MIEIHTELSQHLRELHLPSFLECYQSEADLARQESLPHEHYLLEWPKENVKKERINALSAICVNRSCHLRKAWKFLTENVSLST